MNPAKTTAVCPHLLYYLFLSTTETHTHGTSHIHLPVHGHRHAHTHCPKTDVKKYNYLLKWLGIVEYTVIFHIPLKVFNKLTTWPRQLWRQTRAIKLRKQDRHVWLPAPQLQFGYACLSLPQPTSQLITIDLLWIRELISCYKKLPWRRERVRGGSTSNGKINLHWLRKVHFAKEDTVERI